jgi:hypothetical protein
MTRTILSDLRGPANADARAAVYATLPVPMSAAVVSAVDAGAHVVILANHCDPGNGPHAYISPTRAEADGTAAPDQAERALTLWVADDDPRGPVRVEYAPDSYADVRVMRMRPDTATAFTAGVLCGWGLTDF